MLWAPLRKPHESATDPHWMKRGSVTEIEHPEVGRAFRYATSKWISTATEWSIGRRAPLLNEDAETVMTPPKRVRPVISPEARVDPDEAPSKRGKPFPLHGIRILDFTWFLASAGGTRFLSAFELSIQGLRPTLLLSSARSQFLSAQVLTNPNLVTPTGETVPEQTIQIRAHFHRGCRIERSRGIDPCAALALACCSAQNRRHERRSSS